MNRGRRIQGLIGHREWARVLSVFGYFLIAPRRNGRGQSERPVHNSKSSTQRKRILILAPFFAGGGVGAGGGSNAWIDDFCHRTDLEFNKAPYPKQPESWHNRGAVTPLIEWLRHFDYVRRGMAWKPDCIITSFPQLAFAAAVLLPLMGKPGARLVAWNFNLGSLAGRWKGRLAGMALRRVDRFIVHAQGEIGSYAKWLGIREEKFRFVPLQRGGITEIQPSPISGPYIVSMGSANRDYRTLADAVIGTGIKTVIIAKKTLIEMLPEHPDLIKLSGLTQDECLSILSGAVLNIAPLAPTQTASGQVTFITSMRMGIPTIATDCVGTVDYIRDGETGLLVPPGDAKALRTAIESFWRDEGYRSRIGVAGKQYAEEHFSDEAAGRYLSQVIDEVCA